MAAIPEQEEEHSADEETSPFESQRKQRHRGTLIRSLSSENLRKRLGANTPFLSSGRSSGGGSALHVLPKAVSGVKGTAKDSLRSSSAQRDCSTQVNEQNKGDECPFDQPSSIRESMAS